MVKRGGGGYGEIIALVAIPFRIDPVQGEGHNRQDICAYGISWPGGIDLAGGHILNIILISDIVVAGSGISGASVMDDDKLRYDDAAQDDLAGLGYWLYLVFGYFRRVSSI